MGKTAPAPSDYKSAATQTSSSTRPDVNNPFSTTQWSVGPDGKPVVNQGLSQGVMDAYGKMTPFDLGSFGPVGTGDEARQQTIDAAYTSAQRGLDPRFRGMEDQQRTQLANQGLDPNSAAARAARAEMAGQKNSAYGQAMSSAIQQGNAAQNDVFRNNMMSQQQAIANALRARTLPLEDMGMLRSFMGPLNYGQGADYLGAAGMQDAAAMRKWQAEMQANSDLAGGIFKGLTGFAGGLFGL